jgi:probable addiction module antidote protein
MEPATTPFDPAEYLGSEDDIVEYINVWMEYGSPREIARALGDVARSKGLTEVSVGTEAGQQVLFAALSEDGNPTLEMLAAALDALDLELCVKKRAA